MPISHVWQNVALVVVLAAALYLSIASIAAIPALEEPGDGQGELTALRTGLAAPDRQFNPRQFQPGSTSPYSAVEGLLREGASASHAAAAEPYAAVSAEVSEGAKQREILQHEYEGNKEWWRSRVLNAQHAVLETFKASAARKGNYERTQHYVALLSWYDRYLHEGERELNECVRALEQADGGARRWTAEAVRHLRGSSPGSPAPALAAYVRWETLMEQCTDTQRWDFPPLPERQPLGERYGAFRWVAQWLVQSESLSLVAVAGLVGFGLLGAATSTIIRERVPRARNAPMVSDLPSVIIRGFSAAIVVFLAVKGGLAIFAVGSPEPNPYVLLLSCFIAAVFSEAVWEGARSYLDNLVERWGGGTKA